MFTTQKIDVFNRIEESRVVHSVLKGLPIKKMAIKVRDEANGCSYKRSMNKLQETKYCISKKHTGRHIS